MTAEQIVQDAGMSARPGFYSGRGATTSDLNDRHLNKIYDAIKTHHGDDAAKNFVAMVADIPVLSATDFLLALYRLESHDWKWMPNPINHKGVYAENEGEAMGTVLSFFGGMSNRDETGAIRGSFIRNHRNELPQKTLDNLKAKEDDEYGRYDPWGYSRKW